MRKIFFSLFTVLMIVLISSCGTETGGYIGEPEPFDITEIPSDGSAGANPTITSASTFIPNAIFTIKSGLNNNIIIVDLTGIQDPITQQWLNLVGTTKENQNIWIEVDGVPKGILVINNSGTGNKVLADLVFLVDNSGSMDEEADSVAASIVKWSTKLAQQGLDLRFGCVGYSDYGMVDGGINLTTQSNIDSYLNRSGLSGISRTVGFVGSDASTLQSIAGTSFANCTNECCVQALRYADQNFSFRTGANRIYVNFTDEPNQPNNQADWSVDFLKDQKNWNTAQGTIHTVFSEDSTNLSYTPLQEEKPWLMSDYTGGSKKFVSSGFENVTLDDLPVTGAMSNSYKIYFLNTSTVANGKHVVKITIKTFNGQVTAEKIFTGVTFGS